MSRNQKKVYFCAIKQRTAREFSLVRIHACHAWGREFESRPVRKKKRNKCSSFFYSSFFIAFHRFSSLFIRPSRTSPNARNICTPNSYSLRFYNHR